MITSYSLILLCVSMEGGNITRKLFDQILDDVYKYMMRELFVKWRRSPLFQDAKTRAVEPRLEPNVSSMGSESQIIMEEAPTTGST